MDCNCGKYSGGNNNDNKINSMIVTSKYEMINMDEAYKRIKKHFAIDNVAERINEVNIFEINASGEYISAEDVYSPVNVPKSKTSVMDGYAVDCNKLEIEKEIDVVVNIYADGRRNDANEAIKGLDTKSQCVYVTTGSPIPDSFNCVIPIEFVEQVEYNKKIKFVKDITLPRLKEGSFIRKVGSDLKEGELVLQGNKAIELSDLSILASVGIKTVKVYKLPVMGILSTGDELIDIREEVIGNKIIDSNRLTLFKLLKEQFPDIKINDYGIAGDETSNIESIFEKAIEDKCDILITSGGVSMGEKDLVKKFLESKGEIIFGRLNMKPGKPTTFGKYNNLTVFGLPGNPVSCIVCYYLLLSFSIKAFANSNLCEFPYKTVPAVLIHDVILDTERPEFSRGVLSFNRDENTFYAYTTGSQQSSRLKSFQRFNCLLALPKGEVNVKDNLKAGNDKVECILIKMFDVIGEDELRSLKNQFGSSQDTSLTSKNTSVIDKPRFSVATITISDRAFHGEYKEDKSTKELKSYFNNKSKSNSESYNYDLKEQAVVPDEKQQILKQYEKYVSLGYNLIVTSGGTGLSPRDITAEVTRGYIDKEATSLSTYIIIESSKITKFACLSNPVVGIKDRTLILNLPGSPKAIAENLTIIENILPHVLNQVCQLKDFH